MWRSEWDMARDGKPMGWLPNEDGFQFIGVKHDGTHMPCTVTKGEDGMHRIKEAPISEFKGWLPSPMSKK